MAKIGIFVGTVYGNALLVAEEAGPILQEQGHEVNVFEDPTLAQWQDYSTDVALVITSTTGQGDFPDSIADLVNGVKDKLGHQPTLRYGVIALGDSSYDHFCGAGKTFDALLQEQGAQRVGEVLLVDAAEDPEPETVTSPWVEAWGKLL
ncbi:MAG: flavodoxin [Enterobacterales bacterium endosymbiont of Blomia tropicalis]|uniref:flavodoxin n=1 Tax=Mixta mediterraneensis TaxID=2758443 RepID=UPI0025A8517E|nr:flavodoxin [Mixta mediterraneensis]MDL4912923.1 flavodoxin [Mixta mediterraneensis]